MMKNDPNNAISLLRAALETFDNAKQQCELQTTEAGATSRVALIRACEDLRVQTYAGVNAELRQVEIAVLETHRKWAAELVGAHVSPILPDSDEFYDAIMATDHGIKLMAQLTSTDSALAMVRGSWDGMIADDDWDNIKEVVEPAVKG